MNTSAVYRTFVNPPTEFGIIPLWFWNDDLREKELLRQLREFRRAGFGGVVPHPRIGLSKRVGYLTEEYFRLVRLVVAECARLGMKVILYDEGCYPSGSARGEVVRENPEFASQCIGLVQKDVTGPWAGFWRPNTGRALMDKHVCTVLGRADATGRVDPRSLHVLEPQPHDVMRIEVPRGRWKLMSVWNACSGGHIRGVFADDESGHQTAPPSADILNPAAVACFLRLTHDQYFKHLKRFFGTTIIGMFTDEPSPMGKGPHRFRGAKPFTPGFVDWLRDRWKLDPSAWLPSLWVDYGKGTEEFRQRYKVAVHDRLHEVYYTAQSKWCRKHGIALTGHPKSGNEMSALRVFDIPGQDVVWRSIEPNSPSALEGEQSVTAKAATSGARLHGRRRILTEVCGAYGWRFTLDELKWLFDWHLVRGNNLINAHAVFYSIRDRRAWESEPDVGVHNVWWPYFHHVAKYTRRICWLLSDGEHICDIAILGDGNNLPWQAAKVLYQNQIDFLYLDDRAVATSTIKGGRLHVGTQAYRAVIIDGDFVPSKEANAKLKQFAARGGKVTHFASGKSLLAQLDRAVDRDIRLARPNPDLRYIHYRKAGLDFYFLVNEGESPIHGQLTVNVAGSTEWWNPLTGEWRPVSICRSPSPKGDRAFQIHLDRRESKLLIINPRSTTPLTLPSPARGEGILLRAGSQGFPLPSEGEDKGEGESVVATLPRRERVIPLHANWRVTNLKGKLVRVPAAADWAQCKGFELLTGTLVYTATVEVPQADDFCLDLGRVGEIAEVFLDGRSKGVRMWAPHRFHLGRMRPGRHQLEVRVTNCMANEFDGLQMPSGLMGPVKWVVQKNRREGLQRSA